ncbi:hypothetical protein Tco_0612487 [Tanacetum coccineum]
MHTRASNSELVEPLPEPERTLSRRLRRRNRRVPFEQRNEPPAQPKVVNALILDINYFRHFLDILENYNPMDNEPMWVADRVVALTSGSAITIPETANEFAIKVNHFTLVKGNYETTQKVLNVAAGGIFLYKTPNQAYQLLEDKVLLKLDWAKNQKTKSFQSRSKQPNPDHNNDDKLMSLKEEAKFMQPFRRTHFYNDYRDRDSNHDNWRSSGRNDYNRDNYRSNSDDKPDLQKQLRDFIKAQQSTNSFVKDTFMDLKTKLETTTKSHQASIQNLEAKFDRLADKQSARPSGSLPSNTQPNPKGSSSKPYQPPQARNKHVNAIFTWSGKSYDPPINLNDQQNNSKSPINFDSEDEDEESTPQPKSQTLKPVKEAPIPKPYKQKIPYPQCLRKKNGSPICKAFLCNALADHGASINLMSPFLHTANAVIRVKQKQLNLGVGTERMTFSINSAMKHSYSNDDTCFSIDVIDEILEEDFDTLLDEGSKILHSIKGTILEEKLFAEFDVFRNQRTTTRKDHL